MNALIWVNRDMRIRDNRVLQYVLSQDMRAFAVVFHKGKKSSFQNKFFWESALDYQESLRMYGITLVILEGSPEEKLPKWVEANEIDLVVTSESFNWREKGVQDLVKSKIHPTPLKIFSDKTLLNPSDLPFAVENMPHVFTSFRKVVEEKWKVNQPVERSVEKSAGLIPVVPSGENSLLEPRFESNQIVAYDLKGGESAAWKRLHEFLWETQSILHYKETRNGMLDINDSSKVSPYLSHGSISPRSIYYETKKFEIEHGASESTYWFVFELLWRDYFKFFSKKIGSSLFDKNGISSKKTVWQDDLQTFKNWCQGHTGVDFVDANMIELAQTGWMSNRGRQIVASYLAKGLEIDWTWGAEWFEAHLIDDDVENNWGNWMYVSGVGTDPRDRMFNIPRQAETYDSDFRYRNKWLQRNGKSTGTAVLTSLTNSSEEKQK